ncbi:MAG: OB-fold domain-containing protein [Turneriella sp.]|nr:OB-fold domain-containing protein [Turneriella sp.]
METTIPAVKCRDCGILHPRGIACCPGCGSMQLEDYAAKGSGSIYTYTIHTFVPVGKNKARAPYCLAVIETDEKMRMTAIVETPDPNAVKIGDRVVFKGYEDKLTPIFVRA